MEDRLLSIWQKERLRSKLNGVFWNRSAERFINGHKHAVLLNHRVLQK
jgi:hypothetical protein